MCAEKQTTLSRQAEGWLWRRFELRTTDSEQINELKAVLQRHKLTRRELAVIVETLRVRPEFALKDFHT